jgi:uncharacterized protein (DUF1778 family)
MKKEEQILIRLSKNDKKMIKDMQKLYNINISSFFRNSILKEYNRLKNENNNI